MDVGASFVEDGETAKAVEPCQRSFDSPAVPAQPFAAVRAATGDTGSDGAGAALSPDNGDGRRPCRRGACRGACEGGRPRLSAIRWVRAGLGTPLFAATAALSRDARLQATCPSSNRRSSSTRWSPLQTPAACQLGSRRQQVMPEQPNSRGSISQGMPERRIKMMPAKARRSSHCGRPPWGLGRCFGRRGAMASH